MMAKAACASAILRKKTGETDPRALEATAFLLMTTAQDLGLPAAAALPQLYVIEGNVSISANLMMGLIRRSGIVTVDVDEGDGFCRVSMQRTDGTMERPYTSEWTMERAQGAGLAGKNVWKSHPANMLRARAISEAARVVCPDLLYGLVYTPADFDRAEDEDATERIGHAKAVKFLGYIPKLAKQTGEDETRLMEQVRAIAGGDVSQAPVSKMGELEAWFKGKLRQEPVTASDVIDVTPETDPPDPEYPDPAPTQAKRLVIQPATTGRFPDPEALTQNEWRGICSTAGVLAGEQTRLCVAAFGEVRPAESPDDMVTLCAVTEKYLAGELELPEAPPTQMPPTGDELGRSTEAHGTLPLGGE